MLVKHGKCCKCIIYNYNFARGGWKLVGSLHLSVKKKKKQQHWANSGQILSHVLVFIWSLDIDIIYQNPLTAGQKLRLRVTCTKHWTVCVTYDCLDNLSSVLVTCQREANVSGQARESVTTLHRQRANNGCVNINTERTCSTSKDSLRRNWRQLVTLKDHDHLMLEGVRPI